MEAQRRNEEAAGERARVRWGRDAGKEVRGENLGASKDLGTSKTVTGKVGLSRKIRE